MFWLVFANWLLQVVYCCFCLHSVLQFIADYLSICEKFIALI